MDKCITAQSTVELLAEAAAVANKMLADQSPLRRALRAHFERFGGVLESKALAAGEDAIYKDTAHRGAGGSR
jgi:hypothetical protein